MFRQDYRINNVFLPFQKKGKKHPHSSREGIHSLRQQNSKAGEKASIVNFSVLFSAEAELYFLGVMWKL